MDTVFDYEDIQLIPAKCIVKSQPSGVGRRSGSRLAWSVCARSWARARSASASARAASASRRAASARRWARASSLARPRAEHRERAGERHEQHAHHVVGAEQEAVPGAAGDREREREDGHGEDLAGRGHGGERQRREHVRRRQDDRGARRRRRRRPAPPRTRPPGATARAGVSRRRRVPTSARVRPRSRRAGGIGAPSHVRAPRTTRRRAPG